MKKVSIVLPTFNGSRFIKESIESVLSQTYTNLELIIVNDSSTDNTYDICRNYLLKDSRIKLISNKTNLKLPASLNKGFSIATGEYLTWTSDDNMYKKNAIEVMVNYLEKNIETDMVSCNADYIDEEENIIGTSKESLTWRKTFAMAFLGNITACFLYRKRVLDSVGTYNIKTFLVEDYDYWCRIAINGKIDYIDDSLYYYRFHENSLTTNNSKVVLEKLKTINKKYFTKILIKYIKNRKLICIELLLRFLFLHEKTFLFESIKKFPLYSIYYLPLLFLNKNKYLLGMVIQIYHDLLKKDVIIWGTGNYGKKIYEILNKHINIRCFCDSFSEDKGDFLGTPIMSYKTAIEKYPNSKIIIASSFYKTILDDISKNKQVASKIYHLDSRQRNFQEAYINLKENNINSVFYCLQYYSIFKFWNYN